MAIFERQPRAIDEKFILLLLENLSLLSKNLPTMHKDINAFYLKLRKKHEKTVLNSGKIQGLSLLGKIYNESSNSKNVEDIETQCDETHCKVIKDVKETTTNTSNIVKQIISDKATSASRIIFKNVELQTENVPESTNEANVKKEIVKKDKIESIFYTSSAQTTSYASQSSDEDIIRSDKAVSNQNWYRQICTRDCAMNTIVKFMLAKSDSSQNFRILKPDNYEGSQNMASKKVKHDRMKSTKVRNDLIKEISLLSPSFKVSKQSQTEKIYKRIRTKNGPDFKVYQLFVSQKFKPSKCASICDIDRGRKKSEDLNTIYRCSSDPSYSSGLVSPTSGPLRGPQASFVSGTPGGRLASWIIESGGPLDNVSRELGQAQLSVQQLQRLLDTLELQQQTHHDTDVSIEGASPNVKKDRRKFGLRKKKSNSKCTSVEMGQHYIDPSSSHMALSTLTAPPSPGGVSSSVPNSAASLPIAFLSTFLASTLVPCAATRPQSLPGAEVLNAAPASLTSLTPDHQLREDFTMLAKDLVTSLKSIVATLVCERGRLRAAMEAADTTTTPSGVVAALRTNLSTALQQNSVSRAELRSRLSRIHDASDLAEISSMGANSDHNHQFKHSLSYSSSCVSASEFFDAEEHDNGEIKQNEIINADETGVIELDGDSSSEAGSLSSEEGSASSDNSDAAMVSAEQTAPCGTGQWSRRRALPAPRPTPGGPSLWNLLYKNIGKDLSQISMPVTINEPLNMLQRLCEELEYSELLDAAAACDNAVERMSLVAAFAVSAYAASAHRAASKPFNPLLAETYECVREDKGFRFLAEQVSHHPPISACHAESNRWVFWQEARIKTKFWGKSMEFQPAGRVHLTLLTTGDHYVWNKVTTCVHNLFGGQRWVDQYGDMHITCQGSDISCKLNFVKASSWSSTRHEVRGAVLSGRSTALRLHGRWSEALHAGEPPAARCLWRPGTMPPDYELYYGFTRFAMELNEMEPGMKETLPHTDTRFRPDQRALEEGDVEAAEQFKLELEQAQRERRRTTVDHVPAWFRKSREEGEETWVFGGEYWKAREAGFPLLAAPPLW
ncbi:oxysterol-binding protein-related protein 3-like isoform X1 [Colias croceus]|uniref:oxysterol-binding protein-related protein 3-like isoform X1 n=1 Tax=Colias crocea TaxID=72248 RepID=UPI001E27A6E2|nr:oxysterol-binding protein-related protein 3-like isoform X1 [Colias croceus]